DDFQLRVPVVPDKPEIAYETFPRTHDTFYYNMYFGMLQAILTLDLSHHIYVDIEYTRRRSQVSKLDHELQNDNYYSSKVIIKKVQQVRSHEVEILQLTDLLVGATGYVNRGLTSSKAKNELVNLIRHRSKYSLTKSTLLRERKFNIFIWEPQKPYFVYEQ